jgi:hypothetical protein
MVHSLKLVKNIDKGNVNFENDIIISIFSTTTYVVSLNVFNLKLRLECV